MATRPRGRLSLGLGIALALGLLGTAPPAAVGAERAAAVSEDPASATGAEQRPTVASRWQFEEASAGTTPDSSTAGNPLTLHGDAAIGTGRIDSGALVLDGVDDYAATATVPVDTTASFTVAGWAQAAAVPDHDATVFSLAGQQRSAVSVRWVPEPADPGWGRWHLELPAGDSSSASAVRVTNPLLYDVLDWHHLAVVYDGFRREIFLYVDGILVEDSCVDDTDDTCGGVSWAGNALSFKADHSLQVGRERIGSAWHQYWPGSIDDLWTFKGVLNAKQVAWLASQWRDTPTEVPDVR